MSLITAITPSRLSLSEGSVASATRPISSRYTPVHLLLSFFYRRVDLYVRQVISSMTRTDLLLLYLITSVLH